MLQVLLERWGKCNFVLSLTCAHISISLTFVYFCRTAEHILNCISRSELPGETPDDVSKRIEKLAALAQKQGISSGKVQGSSDVKKYSGDSNQCRASIFVQFKLLLRRAIRENFRSKATLIIKLVQQITLGVIYGTIYTLGDDQSSIMDRFGLISLIAIGGSNM